LRRLSARDVACQSRTIEYRLDLRIFQGEDRQRRNRLSAPLTAARRTLPFGTRVRITSRKNDRSVVVRINDRWPFVRGRIIDLTPAAAKILKFSGLAPVTVTVTVTHG